MYLYICISIYKVLPKGHQKEVQGFAFKVKSLVTCFLFNG